MKKLLTPLLIIVSNVVYAQETNNEQHYKEIILPKPTHSLAEVGLSGGVIYSDAGSYPFIRAQYIMHDRDHFELSFQLSCASAYGLILGGGIGVNFPLSKTQSYFYPGAAFHYFTDKTMLYGLHIGYNLAVSKYVNLNLEPGYSFLSLSLLPPVSAYSLHAGLRFNL